MRRKVLYKIFEKCKLTRAPRGRHAWGTFIDIKSYHGIDLYSCRVQTVVHTCVQLQYRSRSQVGLIVAIASYYLYNTTVDTYGYKINAAPYILLKLCGIHVLLLPRYSCTSRREVLEYSGTY